MQLSCISILDMRNTRIYTELLEIFRNQRKPLTAREILTVLRKKGMAPNKTTIYRQLENLEAQKIVQKLKISDESVSYEKINSHHHHFICINCKNIEDFHMPEEEKILKRVLLLKKDFVFLNHQFEIFGTCASCAIK